MAAPALPHRLAGRYEVKEVLGEGGMGLVYRAYDTVIRREVALKTIRDIPETTALQLFQKECDVLASLSHPNIVEIFDIGEFEEEGKRKPYFVMPLLSGTTLDNLIRSASHRLTVERTVEIISQTCRGLQAAHERGLVHRDLKPSNIFVMQDDSVKIIDFGVAHITDAHTTMGQKGTLLYMSPEQIEMKPLSPLSDIFSLSVVCYEALTGRQPFRRSRSEEIVEAVLHLVPPPASELNSSVSEAISRVVHKGMAKQPWHRFSSARDFADTLNKALRNEPIEFFDPARLRPRLQRATRALEEGDYQFAGEILCELEAEGHIDPAIGMLRQRLDVAVRQKTIAKLMEGAKARFDEDEDPLALQKIAEILQLDPTNSTALAMKASIESRRSERQVENWYRLVSQHMENHAYGHARQALQNVLEVRPKEPRALQLQSEINRREQEYNKLRQEKVQLHRAAMDAWQNGDVSGALSKLAVVLELDRKAPDVSNPERSATYQGFYNQVRSEHDAINNAYVEARKHLTDRNFAKALEASTAILAKYPNHALFQALKFDIEEQQRQEVSAFIANVDRRVEAEPDLDKRVSILKEALALYPDETHFERSLRLVKDKRDLVNSIIAKARAHEEQGLFDEALGEWEVLRTIYSQYPGLKFEIERLQKRRDQHARNLAKTRRVAQIDAHIHSAEHGQALEVLELAKEEFPDDPELGELEKLVREGVRRANQAQRLMTEGQDLCGQNRFAEGMQLLEQAFAIDEHNSIARAVLCNALVEQTRFVLDSNWTEAETLVERALELNPAHAMAKSMRTLVLDRKREEFVNQSLSRARRLQAAADVAGAADVIKEALASYSQEPRLLRMQDSLERDLVLAQQRQGRRRDLEQLRQLEHDAKLGKDVAATRLLRERAEALTANHPDDPVFHVLATEIGRLTKPAVPNPAIPIRGADATQNLPQATKLFSAAHAGPPRVADVPPPLADRVSARLKVSIAQLRKTVEAVPLRTAALVVAGLAVVALVAIVIPRKHPESKARHLVGAVAVALRTSPPGATILINGEARGVSDLQVNLPPGSYRIEARLDGYETQTALLEVKTATPGSLRLSLPPALPLLRVLAEGSAGKVFFDDHPAIPLEEGEWTMGQLTDGNHELKFVDGSASASFAFSSKPWSLPALQGRISSLGLHTIVVSSMGPRLRAYCSFYPAKASVDGQSPVDIGSGGVEFQGMTPGTHKLAITAAADQHTVEVDIVPNPTLAAFIATDKDVGSLLIVTGEDNAQVTVNEHAYKTKGGQLRIANLPPGEYAVRVSKTGFQDLPEQKAEVRKGEQNRLTFKMESLPRLAALAIQGGMPGAAVLVDRALVGTIQADGSFRLSAINPGDHVIDLRKDRYDTRQLQKHFSAGEEVILGAADVALALTKGELRITFSPADAEVMVSGPGQSPISVPNGGRLSLPAGSYTLTAQVPGDPVSASMVEVRAGEIKNLDLQLAARGMANWEGPEGAWRKENNYFVRRGGGFIFYRATPATGAFVFSILPLKGHKLQWVFDFSDDHNYLLFQMDENYFYRRQVVNGKVVQEVEIPVKSDKKRFRTFQITVAPDHITHQIQQGNSWVQLDAYSLPGVNLAAGKFGLLIQGGDEVALSNFRYYPNLNTH